MTPEKNRNPEVIWSQKTAHTMRTRLAFFFPGIFFAAVAVFMYVSSGDKGDLFIPLLFAALASLITFFSIAPRTYILTDEKLRASVTMNITAWTLPLEQVRKVEVSYSKEDHAKGTGTVIVYASSKPELLAGVYDPDVVAEKVRFFSKKRREELGTIGDRPVLPENSKLDFKHGSEGWTFRMDVDDTIGLLFYGAAFCLTAALAGFIGIFVTMHHSRGSFMIALIAICAMFSLIAWIQGFRYSRRKLAVSTTPGRLSIRYVPSIFKPKKEYEASKIRNLRASGSGGTHISAEEVIARWESSDDVPFFPEMNDLVVKASSLAFDYGGRTITFGEDAKLEPDEIIFLLWHLGKALPRAELEYVSEESQRINVHQTEDETLIEAGPRREPQFVAALSGLSMLGLGFLGLSLCTLITMLTSKYMGKELLITIVLTLGCALFSVFSVWFLMFELFNRQFIRADHAGVTRKGFMWPLNREKKMDVEDIETVMIWDWRIHLEYVDTSRGRIPGNFFIGWMRKGDLIRVADLLKQRYASRIETPDVTSIVERT